MSGSMHATRSMTRTTHAAPAASHHKWLQPHVVHIVHLYRNQAEYPFDHKQWITDRLSRVHQGCLGFYQDILAYGPHPSDPEGVRDLQDAWLARGLRECSVKIKDTNALAFKQHPGCKGMACYIFIWPGTGRPQYIRQPNLGLRLDPRDLWEYFGKLTIHVYALPLKGSGWRCKMLPFGKFAEHLLSGMPKTPELDVLQLSNVTLKQLLNKQEEDSMVTPTLKLSPLPEVALPRQYTCTTTTVTNKCSPHSVKGKERAGGNSSSHYRSR